MPFSTKNLTIHAGARSSPLSRAQVREIEEALERHYPNAVLVPHWRETVGDIDQLTSLRSLDKTDFFTREVDQLVLSGSCRIGIHSAKDLPDPLPQGLEIFAVTEGIDSSDSLVLRKEDSFDKLPPGSTIATSSHRREEMVKALRSDLSYIDLRGNINRRLSKLENGEADGIVVAEAALIRLGLTHLNRLKLPGSTVPGQGKLAVVGMESDTEMRELFATLDSRSRVLYLGLRKPNDTFTAKYLHFPLIKTIPRVFNCIEIERHQALLKAATHLLFTSQSSVNYLFQILPRPDLRDKIILCVGKSTAERVEKEGETVDIIAKTETSEGIIEELEKMDLSHAHFFWPHSSLSRPVLKDYFQTKRVSYSEWILYDTIPHLPAQPPPLESYGEILFTSPSTIDAFLQFFRKFPKDKRLKAIGYVSAKYLTGKEIQANI